MKPVIFSLIFFFLANGGKAQIQPLHIQDAAQPRVGAPLPDFELNHITHYKNSSASRSDFEGRWLFLDFWTSGCKGCIKSFPKINAFQRQFGDKVQFVMIGKNDIYNKGIEQLYEGLREKQNMDLVVAYDSILWEMWSVPSVPHIIIVDPSGIVRFITSGSDLTSGKIQDMIEGKSVSLLDKTKKRFPYNPAVIDSALIYRSVISKWKDEAFVNYAKIGDAPQEPGRRSFKVSNIPLIRLYYYAYTGQDQWFFRYDSLYGKMYPFPIFEVTDSTLFEWDVATGTGFYNYSFVAPDSLFSEQRVMQVMQHDLENIFKCKGVLEKREVAVWNVTGKRDALKDFATQGGRFYWTGAGGGSATATGFNMTNGTVENLISLLTNYIAFTEPPIFDETGILDHIDITVDADLTEIEGVRTALREIGLDLVRGYKPMTVLVIKDSED